MKHTEKALNEFISACGSACKSQETVTQSFRAFTTAMMKDIVACGVRSILAKLFARESGLEKLYTQKTGKRPPGSWRTVRLAKKRRKALSDWYYAMRASGVITAEEEAQIFSFKPGGLIKGKSASVMFIDDPCEQLQP